MLKLLCPYLAHNGEIPAVVEHPPEGGQLCVGDGVVAAELLPQPHGNRQAQDVGAFRTLYAEVPFLSLSPFFPSLCSIV